MNQSPNTICWFEIYVDDIERAKKFYSTVLAIEFQDIPAPDTTDDFKMALFPSDPDPAKMAVGGALIEMAGARNGADASTGTIVYFPCVDCSVEESRVEAAGGKVHKSKFSIGEYGFCAICLDTEGNTFGLYSMQ